MRKLCLREIIITGYQVIALSFEPIYIRFKTQYSFLHLFFLCYFLIWLLLLTIPQLSV